MSGEGVKKFDGGKFQVPAHFGDMGQAQKDVPELRNEKFQMRFKQDEAKGEGSKHANG